MPFDVRWPARITPSMSARCLLPSQGWRLRRNEEGLRVVPHTAISRTEDEASVFEILCDRVYSVGRCEYLDPMEVHPEVR